MGKVPEPYDAYTLLSMAGDKPALCTVSPVTPVKMMLPLWALDRMG